MLSKKLTVLILFYVFLFQSCKKENTIENAAFGKEYFPTHVGHELLYDVCLITKSDFTHQWDTVNYQLKEIIAASYKDIEGRETQRIERYLKNDSGEWVISKVWAANLLDDKAEREEDNIRYVKLYFPITLNQTWNGNALNTLDREDYTYTSVNASLDLGLLHFDSTLTVLQKFSDVPFFRKENYFEKYSTGIGMITKENTTIDYAADISGQIEITKAYIYTETLVSYIR